MKKYLLLVTLVLGGLYAQSQDLKIIKNQFILKQYDKAKPEIDKFLAIEKNATNSEVWYYKAYVDNFLARLPGKPIPESKALFESSYEAIKKYIELDPKLTFAKEEQNSTVFNIYYGFYDLGVKTYNEKNFAESFELFKKSLDVHDYIYAKQFIGGTDIKFPAHDTDVVWNLAILANELKKKDDALIYYKKIADADLSAEKYATAYDELVLKYKREKNAELFNKYLASAKKHYPVDKPYWENQEIDFALRDLENEALLNKYEELIKNLPNNYALYYNYAVEIDKYILTPEAKNIPAYKSKIIEMFKNAVAAKSTIEGNLQLANIYYSKSFDIKEQIAKIKGTKPDEVKLKNELIAQSKSTLNEAIPYAEEAVKLLGALKEYKFSDKTNYKLAVEILVNAYKQSGNAAKVAEYEKLKITVDKL
jgi:hypothetical protein